MQEQIDRYVELLNGFKAKGLDDVAAIALVQEVGKDRRNGSVKKQMSGKATEKQLAWLTKLGVSVEADIGKAEASRLIDKALEEKDAAKEQAPAAEVVEVTY